MNDLKTEIARVEKTIAETKSPYLKKDYEKYLQKLRIKLKQSNHQINRFRDKNYG